MDFVDNLLSPPLWISRSSLTGLLAELLTFISALDNFCERVNDGNSRRNDSQCNCPERYQQEEDIE